MKSTEDTSTYEPPVLTVLGAVHDLTEGPIAGPIQDGLFPNHTSISPSPTAP